jgi:hypothetical protein
LKLTLADDKDKQLLLCLQFACVKAGIRIPCKYFAAGCWQSVNRHSYSLFVDIRHVV